MKRIKLRWYIDTAFYKPLNDKKNKCFNVKRIHNEHSDQRHETEIHTSTVCDVTVQWHALEYFDDFFISNARWVVKAIVSKNKILGEV